MERGRRRRVVLGLGLVLSIGVALIFVPTGSLRSPEEIDWPDVLGEAALALLTAGWMLAVHRAPIRARVFWPFAIGAVLLFAGALQDVLDEFLVAARWTSITENLGKLGGTLLVTLAMWRWLREQARRAQRLHASSRRFEKLSMTDRLTGLFNRGHFFERLQASLDEYKNTALIILDIDNFKKHNDTYGHLEGDQVLVELARIIRTSIRDTDVACRYGGEEFAIILPSTDVEHAYTVAERIREAFSEITFTPRPGDEVQKTVSIGVAQAQPDEIPEAFVERTDLAMFEAKKSGKNRVMKSLAA